MRILVLGSTGFIGSAITDRLVHSGHNVVAVVRGTGMHDARTEARTGDLGAPESLRAAVTPDIDAVVHAAAPLGDWRRESDSVQAMIEALGAPQKVFVYLSGTWVLGPTSGAVGTVRELDEKSPPDPIALVSGRETVETLVASSPITGVVVRPGIAFGRRGGIPGMLIQWAREHGRGRFVGPSGTTWPVVHVDDLARLVELALTDEPGELLHGVAQAAVPVADIAAAATSPPEAPGRPILAPGGRIGSPRCGVRRGAGHVPERPVRPGSNPRMVPGAPRHRPRVDRGLRRAAASPSLTVAPSREAHLPEEKLSATRPSLVDVLQWAASPAARTRAVRAAARGGTCCVEPRPPQPAVRERRRPRVPTPARARPSSAVATNPGSPTLRPIARARSYSACAGAPGRRRPRRTGPARPARALRDRRAEPVKPAPATVNRPRASSQSRAPARGGRTRIRRAPPRHRRRPLRRRGRCPVEQVACGVQVTEVDLLTPRSAQGPLGGVPQPGRGGDVDRLLQRAGALVVAAELPQSPAEVVQVADSPQGSSS